MDHAINDIRQRIRADVDMNREIGITDEDMKDEIQAYVNAVNELEKFMCYEEKTEIEDYLYL